DGMPVVPSAAAKECRTWPTQPAHRLGRDRRGRNGRRGGSRSKSFKPGVAMRCFPFLFHPPGRGPRRSSYLPWQTKRVLIQTWAGLQARVVHPNDSHGWLRDGWPLADDRVKQVKEANDIIKVVEGYLELRPVGNKFKGLCPFHDDHNPSFTVDPQWQNYKCWSCGKYGDVITFVQEYERVSFAEALELLARRAGITLEKSPNSVQNQGRAAMLDVIRWAAQQFHECLLDSPLAEEA